MHYERWRKYGDIDRGKLTPVERFFAMVDKLPDGCWLWTGKLMPGGYGRFWTGEEGTLAHRFSHEQWKGPIPAGLQVDHLCRVRHCVNPDHLEAVTQKVNLQRGISYNGMKTHCRYGHPYDEANTYWRSRGRGRDCRKCMDRRHQEEKRRLQEKRQQRAA